MYIFALVIRLQKTSWLIRLQDVFKTFSRCLQDILKTSCQDVFRTFSRRLQDVLQKCLQDIFKTSCKNVFKASARRLQDLLQRYLQDVFKTYHQVKLFLLTILQKVLQRRLSTERFA